MVIKTTSTAYDNDGNVIASYDNEKAFNAEDVESVIKKFKHEHENENKAETNEPLNEEACKDDEPCRCMKDDDTDGEGGVDVICIDISVDTLKKAALIAGGIVGFRILRNLAKAVL